MAVRASAPAQPTPASGGVIVATKLHIPAPRARRVRRDALVAILAGPGERKLTLLTAPPGSGKTTMLAEWAASELEERPFAWLSLDEQDNDPVRFWGLVLEALRTVEPGLGEAAEAALRAPGTTLSEHVLPLLVNELFAADRPLVLVLDDYHLIRDDEIHASLAFLLDHLPLALHLAVATRSDPPLPLPRMRARGEVGELRAADLRFSDAEAAALLNEGLGLRLAPADVTALQRRTEGWAAGLQLAGLSLRGRDDQAGFIASFAGDDRQITDYLGAEVLDAQPAPLRAFLLRTSVLERLCGSLCDAVTGGGDGAERLARLDRENLFVVPLDSSRRWYRYHHLFGDLLLHRLQDEDPDALPALHRRAARWHEEMHSPEDAVRHSLAAGDLGAAAELMANHWNALFNKGHLMTVARWLDALPEERVRSDSRLWLARVWIALDSGRLEELGHWLEESPSGGSHDAEREAWIGLLQGLHCFKTGDLEAARLRAAWAREAATPGRTPFWHTVATILDGVTRFWGGERSAAAAAFGETVRLAWSDANNLGCVYGLGHLGLIDLELGDAGAAASRLEEIDLMREREPQLDEHFTALHAHLLAARLHELAGEPERAAAELDRGVELARRGSGVIELGYALVERARNARAAGDEALAAQLVAEAQALADACPDPGRLPELIVAVRPRSGRVAASDCDALSEKELGVLRLLPSELSLREIGAELYVSLNTVKTHARSIYLKLGASSREQAVARARERGLL